MPLSLTFDNDYSYARNYSSEETRFLDDVFSSGSSDGNDKSLYLEKLFLHYQQEINKRYPKLAEPYFTVTVVQEGIGYTVEFGPGLLNQLCRLYFIYGWDFIHALETVLKITSWAKTQPGLAIPLYVYTKKTLLIAIRHSLSMIEIGAKRIAYTNLRAFRENYLNKQLDNYRFEDGKDLFSDSKYKVISNKTLSVELHKLMREAIAVKNELKRLTTENEKASSYNQVINNMLAFFYGPSWGLMTGYKPIQYDPLNVYDEEVRELQTKLFTSLQKLSKDHVLALILIPGIGNDYADPDLETDIYKLGENLKSELQKTEQDLHDIPSRNQQSLPSRVVSFLEWENEDKFDIDRFPDVNQSIEKLVADRFESDGDISLLSTEILDDLLRSGYLEKDSFLYPVWYQYRDSLLKRASEKQMQAEQSAEQWNHVNKISSVLTLALLVPGLGEALSPFTMLVNLSVLFHTASSINATLDALKFQVNKSILNVDAKKPDFEMALYNTGYVLSELNDIKTEVALLIAKEYLLNKLESSTNIFLIKRGLAWRRYAIEIEILYD